MGTERGTRKPPPHMHTAAPLINYHHDSRGGTKYNAVSDCHSYILPVKFNVKFNAVHIKLIPQLVAMVLRLLSSAGLPPARGTAGGVWPPLPCLPRVPHVTRPHFGVCHQQGGEQRRRGFLRRGRAGRGGGAQGRAAEVAVARAAVPVQPRVSRTDGHGAGSPRRSYLGQALNPCCSPCHTASARKYLASEYETSAARYGDRLPANLISSSTATALSTTKVFYPAIFSPCRHPQEVLY